MSNDISLHLECYALHQYLRYNRNTLPQIHWNNLSCSFLPDGHFLCNMTMLESSFEPGRFDSVFFTPDLFTFIKMNNVYCVLWNFQKNNKTSWRYVFFRFEHPFSCKISLQWPNLIKWICEDWDTLSAANFYMVVLWVITPLNTMTWWNIHGLVCNLVKAITMQNQVKSSISKIKVSTSYRLKV